jgi:hypothetical protein
MNCESARLELVECARRGGEIPAAVGEHVASCRVCRERWQAERDLSSHLRALRSAAVLEGHEWSKAVLLREFDTQRRHAERLRWTWVASAAAVLALSFLVTRDIPGRRAGTEPAAAARAFTPREYPREVFAPAEEAGEEGFIKLPFALPPVPGETFGIVRTQLDPAQLVEMGVRTDPAWTGTLEADVLVGQDGLAQAVRLPNDDAATNGGTLEGY